jgi:hypothetical protein
MLEDVSKRDKSSNGSAKTCRVVVKGTIDNDPKSIATKEVQYHCRRLLLREKGPTINSGESKLHNENKSWDSARE